MSGDQQAYREDRYSGRQEPPRRPAGVPPWARSANRVPEARHLPLPEAVYALAHGENGKSRYHPKVLEAVLAGALLAELLINGGVRIDEDVVVPQTAPPNARELYASTVQAISETSGAHKIAVWLGWLAENITEHVAESLVAAGLYQERSSRRLVVKVHRVVPADPELVARTETWLGHALTTATPLPPTSAAFCALARELGIASSKFDLVPDGVKAQRLELIAAACEGPLSQIIAEVHAIVAVAAMGVYR